MSKVPLYGCVGTCFRVTPVRAAFPPAGYFWREPFLTGLCSPALGAEGESGGRGDGADRRRHDHDPPVGAPQCAAVRRGPLPSCQNLVVMLA